MGSGQRLTDRRSQSQTCPSEPVLIFGRKTCQPMVPGGPQVIEPANDSALSAVGLPTPSILYRGAGLKPDDVSEGEAPPVAAPLDPPPGGRPSYQRTTRGGARNRADRSSPGLTTAQLQRLMEAVAHAERIGLPLIRFTTVHWEMAGVRHEGRATTAFLDSLRRSARRRGHVVAWVWVRENGYGKGGHLHLLWHGPADWPDLESCLRRAMRAAGVKRRVSRLRDTRAVGRRLRTALSRDPAFLANLGAVCAYVAKGATSEAALALSLDRSGEGGRVIGKRCGVSENLGPAARRAFEKR